MFVNTLLVTLPKLSSIVDFAIIFSKYVSLGHLPDMAVEIPEGVCIFNPLSMMIGSLGALYIS
ncbi:MAG: hypothetical protein AB8U25_07265 [Rickettsiales endosymbiont of Dermacentor nuttalli]